MFSCVCMGGYFYLISLLIFISSKAFILHFSKLKVWPVPGFSLCLFCVHGASHVSLMDSPKYMLRAMRCLKQLPWWPQNCFVFFQPGFSFLCQHIHPATHQSQLIFLLLY